MWARRERDPSQRALLLVVLDDLRGPDLRLVRILAEFAQRAPLPQEIPTLVELDAHRSKPRLVAGVLRPGRVESVLLVHELLDRREHLLVRRVFRHGSPPKGGSSSRPPGPRAYGAHGLPASTLSASP